MVDGAPGRFRAAREEATSMDNSEKEIARRVLEAVLKRLDDDARGLSDSEQYLSANEFSPAPARTSNGHEPSLVESQSPVIFIVVNQEAAPGNSSKDSDSRPAAESVKARNSIIKLQGNEARVAHPGLEKFPIAEDLAEASAPKNCFMEPDRVCVNSGACEMRGY